MAVEKNAAGLYEVEVDGLKYEFEKWGAEESLATLLKLSRLVGKPLGQAMAGLSFNEDKTKVEINFDIAGEAIGALMQNMDEDLSMSLIKKLCSEKCLCNGAKINFNVHYQDKLDHMFKVVAAALEVQYGNFFVALLGSAGASPLGFLTRARAK